MSQKCLSVKFSRPGAFERNRRANFGYFLYRLVNIYYIHSIKVLYTSGIYNLRRRRKKVCVRKSEHFCVFKVWLIFCSSLNVELIYYSSLDITSLWKFSIFFVYYRVILCFKCQKNRKSEFSLF